MTSGATIGPGNTRLAPPCTAGATLSGCPSSSAPRAMRSSRSSSSPRRAVAAAAPATVAAAEDPSPRATGTSESATSERPAGTARPALAQAAAKPRVRRSASGGMSRAPSVPWRSRVVFAPEPPPVVAVTRSHRSTATPTQSNPAPRLDVDPGTRTVTRARIVRFLVLDPRPENRNARAQYAAGGRFSAHHHDHFGCKFIVIARAP